MMLGFSLLSTTMLVSYLISALFLRLSYLETRALLSTGVFQFYSIHQLGIASSKYG